MLLVGFGQTICKANGWRCEECKIEKLCPSSKLKEEKKETEESDLKEWVSKLKETFKEGKSKSFKKSVDSLEDSNIFISKRK